MASVQELNDHITQLFKAINIQSGHLPDWEGMLDFLQEILGTSEIYLELNGIPSVRYSHSSIEQNVSGSKAPYVKPLKHAQLMFTYDTDQPSESSSALLELLTPHLNNAIKLATKHEENLLEQRWKSLCFSQLQGATWQLNLAGEVTSCNIQNTHAAIQQLVKQKNKQVYLSQDISWINDQISLFIQNSNSAQIVQCPLQYNDQHWISCLIYQPATNQNWLQTSGRITLLLTQLNTGQYFWNTDITPMSEVEARIITLFANGLSAEDVAKQTDYKIHTVYSYIKKFYSALGINNQSQLTAAVWRQML